jgi:hypothetical protein
MTIPNDNEGAGAPIVADDPTTAPPPPPSPVDLTKPQESNVDAITPEEEAELQAEAVDEMQVPSEPASAVTPPGNPLFIDTGGRPPPQPGGVASDDPDADTHPPAPAITITADDAPATLGPAVSVTMFQSPNGEETP